MTTATTCRSGSRLKRACLGHRLARLAALVLVMWHQICAVSATTVSEPAQRGARGAAAEWTAGQAPPGLETYIRAAMAAWGVPGLAIAVVRGDHVVYANGFGVRDSQTRERVTAETIFPIGSVTKSFTATAIAMLVDAGKMTWDAPVKEYLPSFETYDPYVSSVLSLRDIACHRTGIEQANYLHWGPIERADTVYHPTRADIVRAFKYLQPSEPFRTRFVYKNEPWVVAGAVVEAVSGETWDRFIHERLFAPLGMRRSSTSVLETDSLSNVSSIHMVSAGRLLPMKALISDVAGPMGSINSTVLDLAQYVRFQLGDGTFEDKRLLSTTLFQELHEPQMIDHNEHFTMGTPFTQQVSYSLGWWVQDYRGYKLIHHAGEPPGGSANVFFLPAKGLGVVVLANADAMSLLAAIALRTIDSYLGAPPYDWNARALSQEPERLDKYRNPDYVALLARRAQSRVPDTKPSLSLASYAGTYHNDAYGDLYIIDSGGKLTARLWTHTGELSHWNYDTFAFKWDASRYFLHVIPERQNLVRFDIDERGIPSRVVFLSLGTFVRAQRHSTVNGNPADEGGRIDR
jgi:CubicO group peptidase (beta-lactamase class C family)